MNLREQIAQIIYQHEAKLILHHNDAIPSGLDTADTILTLVDADMKQPIVGLEAVKKCKCLCGTHLPLNSCCNCSNGEFVRDLTTGELITEAESRIREFGPWLLPSGERVRVKEGK